MPRKKASYSDKARNAIIAFLQKNNIHDDIDSYLVDMLAYTLEQEYKLRQDLQKHGTVQITRSGYSQKTGHFTAWKDAAEMAQRLTSKLGIDAIFRKKLKGFEIEEKEQDDGLLK